MKDAVDIDIEGDRDSHPRAVGPGYRVCDHLDHLVSFLALPSI
jgi:hypothetical protein